MSFLNEHENHGNPLAAKCYLYDVILLNLIIEAATGSDTRKTIHCK